MADALARRLWEARTARVAIDLPPGERPTTGTAAYAVQMATTALADARVLGFKVGATAEAAMRALALDAPFHGPVFDRFTWESGAEVPIPLAHQPRLETEFVVGLGVDLPGRDAAYSVDDVARAVAWVGPGFEIVGTRVRTDLAGAGPLLIADGGANVGYVAGAPVAEWRGVDLASHPVTLYVNGEEAASGHAGMSIWGNALGAVAWLASERRLGGRGLRAGDLIMTGTCTGILPIAAGDEARADFGALGEVRARFVAA